MSDPVGAGPGPRAMAEIDQALTRRRSSRELPPDLERGLDREMQELVRAAGAGGLGVTRGGGRIVASEAMAGATQEALSEVAEEARPDVGVPLLGWGGERLVKRQVRRLTGWYVNYLSMQLGDFGSALSRMLRLLSERIAALEADPGRPAPDPGAPTGPAGPGLVDPAAWSDVVVAAMAGVEGRVLHAECGEGRLLLTLGEAGLDAYGLDPRPAEVAAARERGVDAWPDAPMSHLESLAPGALGGLILSGWVDRQHLGGQRRLVALAGEKLAPGGVLVVLAAGPAAWASVPPPPGADLAGCGPLHAETWCHLVEEAGFQDVRTGEAGPERVHVEAKAAGRAAPDRAGPVAGPHAALEAALDAALSRLGALPAPAASAVIARRPAVGSA